MRQVALSAAAILGVSILTASSPIASPTLAPLNNNSNQISVSQPVTKTDTTTPPPAPATPQPEPEPQPDNTVTVQAGDNLTKIAAANGTTAIRLFYANTDIEDPDLIYPGQEFRIPAADEDLTTRAVPANTPVVAPPAAKPAPAEESAPAPAPSPALAPAPSITYRPAPVAIATPSNTSVWDRLAACESSGNWHINTGNGFYGGLQFTLSSWRAVGGTGRPDQASREEQIARAQMLQALQGWGAWPVCSVKAGLR